jgi:hypothetical protein
MLSTLLVLVAVLFSAFHVGARPTTDYVETTTNPWSIKNLKSVVTFGDSYTDESRVVYFIDHNGTAPPAGWIEPVVSLYIICCRSPRAIWSHFWHLKMAKGYFSSLFSYQVTFAKLSENTISAKSKSSFLFTSSKVVNTMNLVRLFIAMPLFTVFKHSLASLLAPKYPYVSSD